MICISINVVQPAITDPNLMHNPWWAASRKIVTGQQWVYDFYKQSIDNGIIFNFSHQSPESLTCDSPICNKYFSSSMENAQAFVNHDKAVQLTELFENNGYTMTVTTEEISAVDLDSLKNPEMGWVDYIINPDNGWFDNMPFDETYTEFF
jgi:hypothetical protein